MKTLITLLITLLALMIGSSAIADEDKRAINQLYADWRQAVETANIPQYVSVLAQDVRLMPPDADAIIGKDGYGAFLEPVFAAATYRIDVEMMPEIEVIGDIAVAEYEYVIHLDLKEGAEITQPGAITVSRSHNRYFDVLRRNSDGQWRVWRHLWRAL